MAVAAPESANLCVLLTPTSISTTRPGLWSRFTLYTKAVHDQKLAFVESS